MFSPLPAVPVAGRALTGSPSLRRLASFALPVLLLSATGCPAAVGHTGEADSASAEPAVPLDPAHIAALDALERDRPWLADSALRPALVDSTRRSPEIVYLAARVAAFTGAWTRVDSILGGEPWLDSALNGRGRELLANAALERDADALARTHARSALAAARTAEQHGRSLVLLARAQERLRQRDSARIAYDEAAALLPLISDWLYLRAASLTRDREGRAHFYDLLRTSTGRSRGAWQEATILEGSGHAREAIRLYDSLGANISSLRLRAAVARGGAQRSAMRRELIAFIGERSGTDDARAAVEILDAYWSSLPASDELTIAFSAARSGPLSRSRTGFRRAFAAMRGSPHARYVYGTVLARMNRRSEALQQFALVKAPAEDAGDAAYERARILLARGQRQNAITALRTVLTKFPGDTSAASSALMLLGDIATDDHRESAARDAYVTLAARYPTSELAPRARFQGAISAYAAGRTRTAAAEMDSLIQLYPASPEASGARYWSGRAWERLKDTARAREQWEWVVAHDPLSYYASPAAERLGDEVEPWAPEAATDRFESHADIDSAVARAVLLRELGMWREARFELDYLARQATADPSVERLLSSAYALREVGEIRAAMSLGRQAVERGVRDARAYRLIYPLGEADLLASEALRQKVDPALVASVIRQESSFNRRATSPVGARGLMQIMPRVARALARTERIRNWDPSMLYRPEVNVRLGVAHLRAFVRHYDHPSRALAAYNAGGSRVARWSKRAGARDPYLFVERIRFDETRGYVRAVLRGRDMYRALYRWPDADDTAD